jgi:hypothetical protein
MFLDLLEMRSGGGELAIVSPGSGPPIGVFEGADRKILF